MTLVDFYQSIGEDYEEVLERFGSDRLIEKYLLRFPTEPSYQQLMDAVGAGDWKAAFQAAHNLKGVASNVGCSLLSQAASDLTEQLRPGGCVAEPSLVQEVTKYYDYFIKKISLYKEG